MNKLFSSIAIYMGMKVTWQMKNKQKKEINKQ